MAHKPDSPEVFTNISTTINQLHFSRTQDGRNILNKALDELNSLNYRYPIVTSPTKALLLINQCCSCITTDDEPLIQKLSQLLKNLIIRQDIVIEGRTLTVVVQWGLSCLKVKDQKVLVEVLQALDAILRSSIQNISVDVVTKDVRGLIERHTNNQDILLWAINCLEACTLLPSDVKHDFQSDLEQCAEVFQFYLSKKHAYFEDVTYSKIIIICLTGLQNVILNNPVYLKRELGAVLGFIKSYMLYGVKNIEFIVPQKLLPSTLSIPEVPGVAFRPERKGGKLTKQRKHRVPCGNKRDNKSNEDWLNDGDNSGYTPATISLEPSADSNSVLNSSANKVKTSDSDFSDTEGGKLAKLTRSNGKVRQAALNLFYNVVKQAEKSTIFAYWSSFIPEGTTSGQHNLITCFLKDPSAGGRIAALNVLLLLLTSSKLYLAQAETSDKSTSFTPFSVVLGLMLKELHKCLSLALNEVSIPVLTQVLKCLAALVQATPYHRMSPGIITKIVRNVKSFIYHKDTSLQVTALIVLGCVLASEPIVPETQEVMLKLLHGKPIEAKLVVKAPNGETVQDLENFDFAQFSSDEEVEESLENDCNVPWLLKKCMENLGWDVADRKVSCIPAPVKLESLQVLSAMSRSYFKTLILPNLPHITKSIDWALCDRYTDLRLHAGRAVDFIGQAMTRYLANEEARDATKSDQCILFWQTLLNKSLIKLLQNEQHPVIRAVGCDCLGSIGSHSFEQLPRDKQILCVTLLFACSRDEEGSVRGAAVRALAICVQYPSLREDPGFVFDTSEAIHRTMRDESLMVRVKSAWSLGNLSDALVLNNKNNIPDELPHQMLLQLLAASIAGATDNDKMKMNAVRALGNLLQLVTKEHLESELFKLITERAFTVLVKNCSSGSNMKVRWNSCYALGNAMKNSDIYSVNPGYSINTAHSQVPLFNSLMDLVVGFRNFKVRINAAVALSSPTERQHYGCYFVPVWIALLKALENSHNMQDFTEYKHRDHLIEQVCLALGHLTTLLTKDDLIPLQETLALYVDLFKSHVHKVLERVVPEKSTVLFAASCYLTNFEKTTDLTNDQRKVVDWLKSIYITEI